MSTPAGAAPEEEVAAEALRLVTFTSVGNGHRLDLLNNPRYPEAPLTRPAPGHAQTWRFNTANSHAGFTIINDRIGKCLDVPDLSAHNILLKPCDGRASLKWYFQPVAGSAQKAFMIRHEATNNCLTWTAPDHDDDEMTRNKECDGSKAQHWTLPDNDAYTDAWKMAVDYAAARCGKDSSNCSWTTTSQEKPKALPSDCVSPVWQNNTGTAIRWTFSLNTTTGWVSSIGFKLGWSLSAGIDVMIANLKTEISAEVSGSITLDLRQELGNSLEVTVPPRNFGWVTLSALATKAKGTWTFDAQGFPWTAEDEITVPLKHAPGAGASIYTAHTSTTFTSCDVPATHP